MGYYDNNLYFEFIQTSVETKVTKIDNNAVFLNYYQFAVFDMDNWMVVSKVGNVHKTESQTCTA